MRKSVVEADGKLSELNETRSSSKFGAWMSDFLSRCGPSHSQLSARFFLTTTRRAVH